MCGAGVVADSMPWGFSRVSHVLMAASPIALANGWGGDDIIVTTDSTMAGADPLGANAATQEREGAVQGLIPTMLSRGVARLDRAVYRQYRGEGFACSRP